jgi:hypothetical protein
VQELKLQEQETHQYSDERVSLEPHISQYIVVAGKKKSISEQDLSTLSISDNCLSLLSMHK